MSSFSVFFMTVERIETHRWNLSALSFRHPQEGDPTAEFAYEEFNLRGVNYIEYFNNRYRSKEHRASERVVTAILEAPRAGTLITITPKIKDAISHYRRATETSHSGYRDTKGTEMGVRFELAEFKEHEYIAPPHGPMIYLNLAEFVALDDLKTRQVVEEVRRTYSPTKFALD